MLTRVITTVILVGTLTFGAIGTARAHGDRWFDGDGRWGRGDRWGDGGGQKGNSGDPTAPELDPTSLATGIALLAGGIVLLNERRRARK